MTFYKNNMQYKKLTLVGNTGSDKTTFITKVRTERINKEEQNEYS